MQSAAFQGFRSATCPRSFRPQQSYARLRYIVRRNGSRRQTRSPAPTVVSSALAFEVGSGSNVQALANILSALAVGAGAWYYYKTQNVDRDGRQICPRCHGTGVVECFCQRWSDNDVGCGTCGGTGKMVCNSCNGGGTAVPIEAKVHIEPRKRINDSFYPSKQSCSCRKCSSSGNSKSTSPVCAVGTHCAEC